MAIQQFTSSAQSTIWDVVLNTYGSVDQVVKLMQDNGFLNVNTYPKNGTVFNFDDTLVENQNNLQSNLATSKFATRDRTNTNDANMVKYEADYQTEYVSNQNGTTVVTVPDLVGMRVVALILEIKPVVSANWSWNPSAGILTLLNGVTIDDEQTLFILYADLITS